MNQKAEDLLHALGAEPIEEEDAAGAQARRARIVPAIEAAMDRANAAKNKPNRMRVILPLAAAAVIALGIGATLAFRQPTAVAVAPVARAFSTEGVAFRVHGGAAARVDPSGADVMAHDEVTTSPSARARIAMTSGSTLEMAAASDVEVMDAWQTRLVAGHVSVFAPELHKRHVAILSLGALIETDDLRASFDVDVDPASHETHVHVAEGRVNVHSGDQTFLVEAGQDWPKHVVVTEVLPPVPPPTALALTPTINKPTINKPTINKPTINQAVTPPQTSTSAPTVSASQLAEQNRLMQSAQDARAHGDPTRALSLLNDLLQRFPDSPLAQAARVERFRSLEQSGQHAAATVEARKYLADYPQGFARDEATALSK